MLKKIFIVIFLFVFTTNAVADEGMWLPMLIKRLNHTDMEKYGLQLTAEEIYSVNQSSLKDAIVSFGGFCSGEIISDQGLLLTNHHCASGIIQSQNTLQNDYLAKGFWAMSRKEELPVQNLYVRFLIRMEDVTERISAVLNEKMSEDERAMAIAKVSKTIVQEEKRFSHYDVVVKDFFAGNEFYLFVYETFTDIRLVGAPPESIGKFGSRTDNWMWPRHTGDFSLFRVYSGPDGKPASYSPENVPLIPKHHLPVSLQGVQEGDFAMVMGYPGSTNRYLTSFGVQEALEFTNPLRIKLKDIRLGILEEEMESDEETSKKYASKYEALSNSREYLSGQTKGLSRMEVLEKKRVQENDFLNWIKGSDKRYEEFGHSLNLVKQSYEQSKDLSLSQIYMSEAALAIEILRFANSFRGLENAIILKTPNTQRIKSLTASLNEITENHFSNYNPAMDKKMMAALLRLYYLEVPQKDHPAVFKQVEEEFKADFEVWTDYVFEQSVFSGQSKTQDFLKNPHAEVLLQDPAYLAATSLLDNYNKNISPRLKEFTIRREKGNRLFVKGLRQMLPEKSLYPDANSTMRLSFGRVLGYRARDAVEYQPYTTLEGIIQKRDESRAEFRIPEKLVMLYGEKDYGPYKNEKGELVVAFITNNDITGGSSGSPVLNNKGQLLGTVFDGNTEAMSGDIAFDPDLQRSVNVDIRYILFIIDKFAGAGYLVKEMTLVKENPQDGEILKEARKGK